MKKIKHFLKEENGFAVVETILLLVVVIGLVLVFKREITDLVDEIFSKIFTRTGIF